MGKDLSNNPYRCSKKYWVPTSGQITDRQHISPFFFIKNKRLFISSVGFSTLEKKRPDMLAEGYAAYPFGCDSPLQIVMAVCRPFCLNSNFLDLGDSPLLTIKICRGQECPKNRKGTRPDSRPKLDLGFFCKSQ